MKTLKVFSKITAGIFLFFLIAGFVIIPVGLTFVIPSQGSRILHHPVHLGSAGFNPFTLHLTLKDLRVLDEQNRLMLGFDHLSVDVDLLDLFKKKYHVHSLEIDGLKINVQLLAGGQINLLDLVPPGPASPPPAAGPMPTVIIDTIALRQGQINFTDNTIKPPFSTYIGDIDLVVTNVTTDPQAQAQIIFNANLDNKGRISNKVLIKPLAKPLEMEMSLNLSQYALNVLTPYVGKYTGRELKNGELDLKLDYKIGENKLEASHKILVQHFEFGKSIESKDALHLPFGLAVALLEDSQGKINISLPATGDMNDPKFDYTHLVFQVVRNFFFNLITKPFSFLASTLGVSGTGTDELGSVKFPPGQAVLLVSQQQKLIKLMEGFKQHPKLRLAIDGGYDPRMDWKSIQADIFNRDYETLRKGSSRPETKVYQLLYQRRFGIRALWALARKYKVGLFKYDDIKLDTEIKRQLIEDSPPDINALNKLAQARGDLIYKFLLINGFEPKQLTVGQSQQVMGSMGFVASPFTLTVFDKN